MPSRLAQAIAILLTALSWPVMAGTVYVADEKGGSISVIDSKTGATKRFDLPIDPHNVDITPDGRLLATGSRKSADHKAHQSGSDGQLIIIDLESPAIEPVAIDVGGHPAHVVPDREGKRAYVSDSLNNSVLVVDLGARKVITRFAVGSYPHGLRRIHAGCRKPRAGRNCQRGSQSIERCNG